MNILLINNEFPPIGGGGSILNYEIAKKLVQMGHKVTLITSSYKDLPRKEFIEDFRVIRVPALRKHKSVSSPLELLSFAVSALIYSIFYVTKFKPDVVQAFFAVPAGGVAYVLHKIYGIPYCIYLGGSDVPGGNKVRFQKLYPYLSPFIKLFWRKADYIISPSDGLIQLVEKVDPKVMHKIVKIPNGVDIEQFTVKPDTHRKITIIAVGRLIYRKGFQDLIQAMGILKKKHMHTNIRCLIVGEGEYEETLHNLVKETDTADTVSFTGSVNYQELVQLYLSGDIFVLPSFSEGMSLALIEAMAARNAIIASNVAGTEEVIQHEKNGFLIEPGQPEVIATYIEKLINNKELLKNLQENAYKTATKYDWKSIANEYDIIYNKMNV